MVFDPLYFISTLILNFVLSLSLSLSLSLFLSLFLSLSVYIKHIKCYNTVWIIPLKSALKIYTYQQ